MNQQQVMADDGMAAHQLQLEQQEQEAVVVGFECPYCGTIHAVGRSNAGDGSDIACCGEVGHVTPYTRGDELNDEYEADMQEKDAEYDARNWGDYRPSYRTSSGDC